MLFNSFEFIFAFLPITIALYYLCAKFEKLTLAKTVLIVASLAFYAYWDYRYLALLFFSILFNYLFGKILSYKPNKITLSIGVAVNLGLLGYYKYADFFLENLNQVTGTSYSLLNIVLPLAISFFTFQQIGFLVDSYRGLTKEYDFLNYMLFVVFFPQLIAGPIVHHKEVIPQFQDKNNFKVHHKHLVLGLLIFSMGLFKKVVVADSLALWATPAFDQAESLTFFEAWGAALAYTFQLYFDFSGYSEMAIGLGFLFNINLPINFMSPYKANNIIDFWRTWHITLSTFLKDYLYIPLGGNRKGKARKYVNLFTTMVLGGLWHGAGWTFIIWGALHGLYNMINHFYRDTKKKLLARAGNKRSNLEMAATREDKAPGLLEKLSFLPARLLTFFAVLFAWVFFRAETFDDAARVLKGMAGMNGFAVGKQTYLPSGNMELLVLFGVFLWVSFAPNTIEIAKKLKPNAKWAIFISIVLITALMFINRENEFLYFQF
ncbi:MBOAT family O-acyltransferase [Pseudalkalibacillus caeni]|uniref:MBOAT family protein n=1 Tax=Exobacillus caeni TaxID=2574798 RepID=A0A5R9EZC4_9BACL|nr:MBOAT family O-acyltransferase [Pseudalkalibacillus caeni]TLS36662.1 MBOAT family protein [Pseudalkalibacillus caeni]